MFYLEDERGVLDHDSPEYYFILHSGKFGFRAGLLTFHHYDYKAHYRGDPNFMRMYPMPAWFQLL